MRKYFRLNISDTAREVLHEKFMNESHGNGLKKGAYAISLITKGIDDLSALEVENNHRDYPRAGSASVQFKIEGNGLFFAVLDKFRKDKRFYDIHYAGRACLYNSLGLPWTRGNDIHRR